MSGARFAGRVALAAAALSLMMLAVTVGVGQGQSTTAPSQLTQEYPLGGKNLCCAEKGASGAAAANRTAARGDQSGPDDGGSMLWLLLLAPVAVLVLLVWLVAYSRSGPPTAYGYALGNEPRRRRHLPASLIRLLTPLFAYNHHRDAYVLRGIGNRRGPVLKLRSAASESVPVRPAQVGRAAAPLGVRGEGVSPRLVGEPRAAARVKASTNGGSPVNGAAPKAKPKPAKGKATTKARTGATKATTAGKNGKGKKAAAKPKAAKPKAKPAAPSLTEALGTEGKSRSGRAKRRADYQTRQGGGTGSPERDTGADPPRSAATGRFKRDETKAAREDRPAGRTRK